MIKLVDVSKYYHDESGVVIGLRNINLEFNLGEFVAITGESGSGKSTLLNVISGVDTYENGEMYIDGKETSYYDEKDWEEHRRSRIGFIFQNYNLIDSYTVLENVEAALIIEGVEKSERIKRCKDILKKVGLESHMKHKATRLSGGQKQRLAIARALAKDTKIIVADEPTGNLDSVSGNEIIKLLYEISKEKLVIIVTHNYEEVSDYVTRKIRIYDSEIAEDREIRNINPVSDEVVSQPRKNLSFFKKSLTFATKNLKNQPKKTFFLCCVTFIITFFVLLFLITGILSAFIDTSRSNYFFYNNYETRIVATKKDETKLTPSEIESIESIKHVKGIIRSNKIVDYHCNFNNFSGYINTIDVLKKQSIFQGRYPQNENEVVIFNPYLTNEEFDDYYLNEKLNDNSDLIIVGRTSYGITKYNTVIYFHKNTFNKVAMEQIALIVLNDAIYETYIDDQFISKERYFKSNNITISDSLPNNTVAVNTYNGVELQYKVYGYFNNHKFNVVSSTNNYTYISRDLANVFFDFYNDYHITINIDHHDNTEYVINQLSNLGLYSFSPYDSSDNYGALLEFMNVILVFIISFVGFSLIYLSGYVIIRIVMLSKTRDYSILRSIGVDTKTVLTISKFEIIICFLTGFIGVCILMFTLNKTVTNIYVIQVLEYIKLEYYIYALLLNLLLSLLVSRKFNKLIMKKSLIANMKVN